MQPSCDTYVNLARATYGSTIYFASCPNVDIHKYMLYVGLYVFMYACVAMNICAPFLYVAMFVCEVSFMIFNVYE